LSIDWLSIRGLRNLEALELRPQAGVNWLHGANGAGKTSVLEAIYLLARGRSFRTAQIASVIQHGCDALAVVVRDAAGCTLGVERQARSWRGRIDGQDCQRISDFAARLPLVLVEPDSHRFVDGGPEHRRQYLDWLLFHVEHTYLQTWQRYARTLRQRNAALKVGAADAVLDALEPEFVRTGTAINALREARIEAIRARSSELVAELGFALPGPLGFRYRPGHRADATLAEAVAAFRQRDRERGFSHNGPHRGDLLLTCNGHPAAAEMSRGQQKLLALVLQLTALDLLAESSGSSPILLLDDPVSELDEHHLDRLLAWLQASPVQSWVTATTPGREGMAMFHVEQGRVRPML
jgi:DNA replication and repair protein RecF